MVETQVDQINPTEKTRSSIVAFLIILTVGLVLRLCHITWGLPELYEEATPFSLAWKFWNWDRLGFDFNPHFFNYPAFTFYFHYLIQAIHYGIGYLLGIYTDFASFKESYTISIILARIVTVIFDLGTILVIFLLVKQFASEKIALIGAGLLAINPLHIQYAHSINVDIPLAFFVTLSLFFIFKIYSSLEKKWYLLAGLGIGLATATKYNGALLVAPLILAHLFRSQTVSAALRSLKDSSLYQSITLAIIIFFLFNPFIILSFGEFWRDFSFEKLHMSYGHLGIESSESTLAFYFLKALPKYLSWIFYTSIIISIFYIILKRNKSHFILLAFPIIFFITIGTWEMRAERYLVPAIPILIAIGTIGSKTIWEQMMKSVEPKFRRFFLFKSGILVIVGLFVAIPLAIENYKYLHSLTFPDTRTIAKEWLIKNVPHKSTIVTGPYGINLPNDNFTFFMIPFTPTGSEVLEAFYDTRWYKDFDLLIASDYDYGRFAQEPERFKSVLAYYDSLKLRWRLVHKIQRSSNQTGPLFWFYTPPDTTRTELFELDLLQKLRIIEDKKIVVDFTERLAFKHFRMGKLIKSKQLLSTAAWLEPTNTKILRAYVWTLFKLGDYQICLNVVNHSLQIEPYQPEIVALRGSVHLQLGQYAEAETQLLKALEMNNKLTICYFDLELLYRTQNEKQKNIAILNRYLQILPPESETAQLTVKRIQELQNQTRINK
ncbi:MAG: glycosyltransferase family 39 protein [Bacteroidota bacterium]|nr:glycosyltransferase family 39 protein [Bacteroidota bacterium]